MESLHDIVPGSLRERPQWVVWRFVERGGKRTKVPVDPKSGAAASSTDAATWASFDEALAATTRLPSIEGVGFVFTDSDPFCGIDLDKCIDPATGEMLWWGRSIVEALDSYAEISPSGLGVKIFVRARKPGERCKNGHESGAIEMYDAGRFFTVTGSAVGDRREVEDRQEAVDALYGEVFGATPSDRATVPLPLPSQATVQEPLTDDEILKLASNPRRPKGERFAALFAGNWNIAFNSASEADSSVVWTLAYYTKDAAQIDRIFRRSKLLRPKWDEQHGAKTYGEMTIDKALARVTGQYVGRKRTRGAAAAPKPVTIPSAATDRPLPPLYVTREVARLFVAESRRIVYWRGVFHLYTGTRYRVLAEDELVARIARFITDIGWWSRPARMVGDGQWEDGAQAHPDHDGLMVVLELVTPKTGEIREILLQLKIDYLSDTVDSRSWIGSGEHPRADELVACRNGLLHLPSMAMHPHTDAFFSLNAVGYDHAPGAPAPERWQAFLREVFEEDDSAIGTLQELFGYFLLPDTRQQKIGLMVGPKRSGKGTIGRVLTAMLGRENVCGPTLGSLCTNFGLWPLLDKPLAIISDARLSGRADQAVVVERLLSISGEDSITVDRKHLAPWTGTLPTRFLILTNELPRLCDASGALAGRFIVLCLTRSWYGREDLSLTDRLLAELPGILNWSIEGWRRLRARGHFVQPNSSEEARRQLEDLGSPILAFLRERCVVGPVESVEAHELFVAWQGYCHDSGRVNPGTIQSFGRDLRAAVPGLRLSQPRLADGRVRLYEGVGLLHGGSGAARLARMAREAWHCGELGEVVA
jgi:putative DNA primase/helicase